MKRIYYCIKENGDTEFQDASYKEDGWYIVNTEGIFEVWEIPPYGGEPCYMGSVDSFSEAIKISESLR